MKETFEPIGAATELPANPTEKFILEEQSMFSGFKGKAEKIAKILGLVSAMSALSLGMPTELNAKGVEGHSIKHKSLEQDIEKVHHIYDEKSFGKKEWSCKIKFLSPDVMDAFEKQGLKLSLEDGIISMKDTEAAFDNGSLPLSVEVFVEKIKDGDKTKDAIIIKCENDNSTVDYLMIVGGIAFDSWTVKSTQ